MPKHRPNITVVLTQEGKELLKSDNISVFLDDNKFNCIKIEESGHFLAMQMKMPPIHPDIEQKTFRIWIPTHYVLYMTSADAEKIAGFGEPESRVHKKKTV